MKETILEEILKGILRNPSKFLFDFLNFTFNRMQYWAGLLLEVKDHHDGTGASMGDQAYCAYAKYGKEAGGQPCDDHRSFQVDMCSVPGNCPDRQQLPCGM